MAYFTMPQRRRCCTATVSVRTFLLPFGMCDKCVNRYADDGTHDCPCVDCYTEVGYVKEPSKFERVVDVLVRDT